jgi:hypothetical protein
MQVTISFVKGHQDNNVPYDKLPFPAQLES